MPKIWSDVYPDKVSEALTKTQYETLQRWRDWLDDNEIHNDWVGHPVTETHITPDGLTRAALESCIGGAFFPGIETSFMIRDTYAFMEPFRLDPTPPDKDPLLPGDLTKQMAVPWQADFFDCAYEEPFHWWPAQHPEYVFLPDGSQVQWTRQVIENRNDMVDKWHKLGFILQQDDRYVETESQLAT